jgi:hypothetical protein
MTSSPVVRGLAGYQVAAGLLRIDRVAEAEHLVLALAGDPSDPRDDTATSVRGSLWRCIESRSLPNWATRVRRCAQLTA